MENRLAASIPIDPNSYALKIDQDPKEPYTLPIEIDAAGASMIVAAVCTRCSLSQSNGTRLARLTRDITDASCTGAIYKSFHAQSRFAKLTTNNPTMKETVSEHIARCQPALL